jgi:hypothetical protein
MFTKGLTLHLNTDNMFQTWDILTKLPFVITNLKKNIQKQLSMFF